MKTTRKRGRWAEVEAKRCRCGAVTVTQGDVVNHMRIGKFRLLFPGYRLPKERFTACDHCVNRWGIDLCGCGSGKPAGRCRGGYPQCESGLPMEVLAVTGVAVPRRTQRYSAPRIELYPDRIVEIEFVEVLS